jgi:flagellar basal body L-ring protein FlgH
MKYLRVKDLMKLFWLMIFAAGALAGCAVMDELTEKEKPFTPPVTQRKPAPRELGALWSEDSMWNHVYTSSTARVIGDIITIKLDEGFKTRLMKAREGQVDEPPKVAQEKVDRTLAGATDKLGLSAEDKISVSDLMLRGSIEEVGQRGVYRISAGDTLRLAGWEPYVVVKGRVRDRDIDGNDEIRIGDIVDLSFEILNNPPVAGVKRAENVSW